MLHGDTLLRKEKDGYTATPVMCEWAGAEMEIVNRAFGREG